MIIDKSKIGHTSVDKLNTKEVNQITEEKHVEEEQNEVIKEQKFPETTKANSKQPMPSNISSRGKKTYDLYLTSVDPNKKKKHYNIESKPIVSKN